MDSLLKSILAKVYELEGLLLLAEAKGDESDDLLYDMIREKGIAVADMVKGIPQKMIQDVAPCDLPDSDVKPVPEEILDLPDVSETGSPDIVNDDSERDPEESELETDENVCNDQDSDEVDETELELDDEPEPEADSVQEPEQIPEQPVFNDLASRAIARDDFRKMLTLNDKFRFRRELFENSEPQFAAALNVIDAMHSYSEAEDYFYNTLEWDSQSEEVADFMALLKSYFE